MNKGIFDGMLMKDIRTQDPAWQRQFAEDRLRTRFPGGESYADLVKRLEPCLPGQSSRHWSGAVVWGCGLGLWSGAVAWGCRLPGIEAEQQSVPVLICSHISVLQVLYAYFRQIPIDQAIRVSIERHAVYQFTPLLGGMYGQGPAGEKSFSLVRQHAPQCNSHSCYCIWSFHHEICTLPNLH
jgi:broad specificity phosphatase PhoE